LSQQCKPTKIYPGHAHVVELGWVGLQYPQFIGMEDPNLLYGWFQWLLLADSVCEAWQ